MINEGKLLVVSGPSGTGKSTVVKLLVEKLDRLCLSVSATTRPPRESEREGREYYFVDHTEFERRIACGEMLEYASYNGNYYGTPRDKVEEWLGQGFDVLLEIEVQGAKKIKDQRANAVLIFLIPPSMEEAEARLRGRRSESEETLQKRLAIARQELEQAQYYDYIVVNETVEQAVEDIRSILRAEHLRYAGMKPFIAGLKAVPNSAE
jgi:guanylate kinase